MIRLIVGLLCLSLLACGQSQLPEMTLLAKEGISLNIPKNWQLVEKTSNSERRAVIIKGPEITLTIEVDKLRQWQIDEYFQEKLSQETATHPSNHPDIVLGQAQRLELLGNYAIIDLKSPTVRRFLETTVSTRGNHTTFITFSLPLEKKDEMQRLIDAIIKSINIR